MAVRTRAYADTYMQHTWPRAGNRASPEKDSVLCSSLTTSLLISMFQN